MADANGASKPDFTAGIRFQDLQDGVPAAGRAGDDEVILVRRGHEAFAVGAHCTHYHGPLADGLVVGDTVRCPWHHACFSLRTGEALRAPALDAIACYQVERSGDRCSSGRSCRTNRSASRPRAACLDRHRRRRRGRDSRRPTCCAARVTTGR